MGHVTCKAEEAHFWRRSISDSHELPKQLLRVVLTEFESQ